MKLIKILPLFSAMLLALAVSSCASRLKPLDPSLVRATPNPLELIGTQIPGEVTLQLPAKWFHRNAVVQITPELRYQGQVVAGQSITLQGERVRNNYTTISYAQGGVQTIPFRFEYKPGMEQSTLYLTFRAEIKGKQVQLPALKVATGTLMTAQLASVSDVHAAVARDAFQRIIEQQYTADLKFLINRAEVRAQELRKADVQEWEDIVENAHQIPNQEVDIEVQAYASPDGGIDINERLSAERERNTTRILDQKFGKKNIPLTAHYTAEDWEGFQELLEQSNIQDKELVLRVLAMYSDPEEREREIRNLSHVFTQLTDEILPELRRSRLRANVRIIGKSDTELLTLMSQRPGRLNIEELLYTATLYKSADEQLKAYQTAIQLYPKDYRAYNNIGAIYLVQGNYAQAASYFAKAQEIQPNKSTNMNQALLALQSGDLSSAQQLMGQAVDIPEAGQGVGMLALYEGKYDEAIQALQGVPSNSLAIAQIMKHQYSDARQTLDAVEHPNPHTDYLKAIVAARTNDVSALVSNLRAAVAADRALALRAQSDLEFAAFRSNPDFLSVLR